MRVVVCLGLDAREPWQLSATRLRAPQWISGGVRSLHELAAAAAAAGFETEVRGDFSGPVLDQLTHAAGVSVATPDRPRPAQPDDLLLVPDGIRDPALFLRVALMPSTPVFLALAPPGLFGWSFAPGWRYRPAAEVDPDGVGRPEHARAIQEMGFRVWANAETTAGCFRDAGVPAEAIGRASPLPAPQPPPKDVDVVTVGSNRWKALTRRALDGFRGSWRELPALPHARLMHELGRGQVLVHCMRIEGYSRLCTEAGLMGTTAVGLASNRFAVLGAAAERVEDVRPLVESLLADPSELARRQEIARRTALVESDWNAYVSRVGAAIVDAQQGRPGTVWPAMAKELHDRIGGLEHALGNLRARRSLRAAEAAKRVLRRS